MTAIPAPGGGVSEPDGDAPALDELSGRLDQQADELLNLGYDTAQRTALIRDRADWAGAAADAYTAFADGVASGVKAMPEYLHEIAAAIRSYAVALSAGDADSTAAASGARTQVEDAKHGLAGVWSRAETVRAWFERVHVPWDSLAGDIALDKAIAGGELGEDINGWIKELNGEMATVIAGNASWDEVAAIGQRFVTRLEIGLTVRKVPSWLTDVDWLQSTSAATTLTNLGRAMGGLGLAGDAWTIVSPDDDGARATTSLSYATCSTAP